MLIGELLLCPVDKYLIGEGHTLSQGCVKSFALTQASGRSVFPTYQTMGDKTSRLICQLVFQVWVWLTGNNKGKKSISRSKKPPCVPRGNEIETKVALCRCGSSLLVTKHKPRSRGRAQPCPERIPTGQRQTAASSNAGRRVPCPGTAPHPPLPKGVCLDTDGWKDAGAGEENDTLKGKQETHTPRANSQRAQTLCHEIYRAAHARPCTYSAAINNALLRERPRSRTSCRVSTDLRLAAFLT